MLNKYDRHKKSAPLPKDAPQNHQEQYTTKGKISQGRTRSWTFIVYPDSAPENWRDVLDETHVQWIESPLHDKDVNADGNPKKPHWHILMMFESVKEYHQVLELTKDCKGTVPQKCNGAKGLVRYMAHLDNPEKAQYNVADIVPHGGADVGELLKPTSSEVGILTREMIAFVNQYDVVEYQDLMTYAMYNNESWFDVLLTSSYTILQYIKSRRHCGRKPLDPTTGEIYEEKKSPE